MKTTLLVISILSGVGALYLIWRKSPKMRRVVKSTPRAAKKAALRLWEWKE